MKTIKQTYRISTPIGKVWQALVDPKIIEVWSGSLAKMRDQEGFEFELWEGDIYGKNIEVAENKKLVQDWYGGKWDQPSKATFILTPENDGTKIELLHENVPDEEYEGINEGWDQYYLGQIKKLLEE